MINGNSNAAKMALDLFKKILISSYSGNRLAMKQDLRMRKERLKGILSILLSAKYNKYILVKPVLDKIGFTCQQLNDLENSFNEPFKIFVIGMGKFGKSTLVNALVEQRVAEMDDLPKTWKIDIYKANIGDPQVVIKFKSGQEKQFTSQQAKMFLAEEETKREDSENEIDKEFKAQVKQLKTIEEKEELRQLLLSKKLYQSEVVEVIWPCRPKSILTNFMVVDTPGLWQEVAGEKTQADLREYYHKADGVLWLLDANKISSQQPKQLLDDLKKALEMIGSDNQNLIGVLNRIDLAAKNDPVMEQQLLEEANRLFGNTFREIVPFSAKLALQSVEENNVELEKRSGLTLLHQSIERNFLKQAASLQCSSKANGLFGYLKDLNETINVYRNRLDSDEKKRLNMKANLTNELVKIQKDAISRMNNFLQTYKTRVKQNIDIYAKNIFDFDENSKEQLEGFISEKIFEYNTLNEKIKEHQVELENELNQCRNYYSNKSCFREFEHLQEKLPQIFNQLNIGTQSYISSDQVNTSRGEIASGFGALAFGAFFGPIGILIAGILSCLGGLKWFVVKMKLPGVKDDLNSQLSRTVADIEKNFNDGLTSGIEKVKTSVNEIREKSFASLHGPSDQVNETIALFGQIREMRNRPISTASVVQLIKGGIE